MKTPFRFTCFLSCLLIVSGVNCLADEKQYIGWIEMVTISPGDLEFKAKIDTGARTSSINAKNIREFNRDGEDWVSFEIINNNGEVAKLEMPVQRVAIIKRHFGKRQKRYVVDMNICLGKISKTTEVTLVDREGFLYSLLIGRGFLKKDFIIDPSEQFTIKPRCGKNQ